MCNGVNNPDLEAFIQYKYGFTYPDEKGYSWGEKQKGWTTYKSNSTLRNYLPPVEVYQGFKVAVIDNFKKGYPASSPRKAIIAWDEIETRFGLVWNPSTKELIGRVSSPIAEKDARSANWAKPSRDSVFLGVG